MRSVLARLGWEGRSLRAACFCGLKCARRALRCTRSLSESLPRMVPFCAAGEVVFVREEEPCCDYWAWFCCLPVSLLAPAVSAESATMSHDCLSTLVSQHISTWCRMFTAQHHVANGLNNLEANVPSSQTRSMALHTQTCKTCFTRTVAFDRPRHLESQRYQHRRLVRA